LRAESSATVNRAAWALASLKAEEAVPKLVPALVTTQYQLVMVPSGSNSGGGGLGINFEGGSPIPSAPPIAYNGSSVAYMAGPVVGPGVAAYGAVGMPAIPYGFGGTQLTVGGGGQTGKGPMPRLVPVTYQNVEVRNALTKLTGQDFGYDTDS